MENKIFLQIHKKYFNNLKRNIIQDTKDVVKLLSEGKQREADNRFSRSFRELWACFEKEDKNGHFKDILNEEELPYRKVFNELKEGKNYGITRPKISGWLTELYVYYFVKNLLEHEKLERDYRVSHSKKVGDYTPDILIIENSEEENKSLLEKLRVAIEVKTIIYQKNVVDEIIEKRKWYREKKKGYYLFFGEISSKYRNDVRRNIGYDIKPIKESVVQYLENRVQSEEWVYLPYLINRLSDIVNRILNHL